MSNDYDVAREYGVPPGVLSPEEMRLLREGGVRLDDSDGEGDYDIIHNRHTQPRYGGTGVGGGMNVGSVGGLANGV